MFYFIESGFPLDKVDENDISMDDFFNNESEKDNQSFEECVKVMNLKESSKFTSLNSLPRRRILPPDDYLPSVPDNNNKIEPLIRNRQSYRKFSRRSLFPGFTFSRSRSPLK